MKFAIAGDQLYIVAETKAERLRLGGNDEDSFYEREGDFMTRVARTIGQLARHKVHDIPLDGLRLFAHAMTVMTNGDYYGRGMAAADELLIICPSQRCADEWHYLQLDYQSYHETSGPHEMRVREGFSVLRITGDRKEQLFGGIASNIRNAWYAEDCRSAALKLKATLEEAGRLLNSVEEMEGMVRATS